MKRDPYEVLGIRRGVTEADAKSAFKKLAFKHHPDRGGSEERFKEISEAFKRVKSELALTPRNFNTATRGMSDEEATGHAQRYQDGRNKVRTYDATSFKHRVDDLGRPSGGDAEDYDSPLDSRPSMKSKNLNRPTRKR